jgi:hypothetical protein
VIALRSVMRTRDARTALRAGTPAAG